MKYIVSGKNISVTEALKEKSISKLNKLGKFFKPDTEVRITMSVQKNRQIIEVTIPFNGIVLRAEEDTDDMYASIDKVVDALEKQIIRNKTRISKRIHESGDIKHFAFSKKDDTDYLEEEGEFKVLRSKRFSVKPMSIEEAILQMNLIGHQFFMFTNAETKEVNVVYKRKDGNYGLIEPKE